VETSELDKFLEDNKADILEATRKQLIERISGSLKWSLPETFNQTVADFLAKEIVPEVQTALLAEKGAIITAVKTAAAQISDELAKAITLRAAKTLANDYSVKDVIKHIFDARY
jgi:hypothetical protein